MSLRRIAAASLAGALLAACSPSRPGIPVPAAGREAPAGFGIRPRGEGVRARIVYVIHGDADYVYHDSAGRRRLADRDALAQAMEVGRGARAAEVLIFHQEPRRHRWSAPGGTAYRFRGGALEEARRYARAAAGTDSAAAGFAAEAALFSGWIAGAPGSGTGGVALAFVYFGHEIPPAGGLGYSRSLPREAFNLARFVRGLERFGGGPGGAEKPFALIVLSACRGGTPATTSALFPYADRVLASPTELHLSFLDTRAFIAPFSGEDPRGTAGPYAPRDSAAAAARRMLDQSFMRLSASTQAPIALTLYEADKAAAYLEAAAYLDGRPARWNGGEDPARDTGTGRDPGPPLTAWRDCGEDPGFGPGGEEAGAQVRYRPGRFGRLKGKQGHSGWECL